MSPSANTADQSSLNTLAPMAVAGESDGNNDGASVSSFVSHRVRIAELDKALVLKCLYNYGNGDGINVPRATSVAMQMLDKMDIKVAEQHIEKHKNLNFDYVDCKPIKVDLSGDYINTLDYDQYHGIGTAAKAVACAKDIDCRQKFPEENRCFDEAFARMGKPCLNSLSNGQLFQLLAEAGVCQRPNYLN